MKLRILVAFLTALLVWSCSSDEPSIKTDSRKITGQSSRFISPDEACSVARKSFEDFGFSTYSRSTSSASVYLYNPLSNSRSGGDTVYYTVNFDGGGFALVLADKNAEVKTVAISETGTFENNLNPAFEDYLSAFVCDSFKNILKPTYPFKPVYPGDDNIGDYYYDEYGNRIKVVEERKTYENYISVSWAQGYPYNVYCDALSDEDVKKVDSFFYNGRGLVGCVAVAIGQICSYHKKPNIIDDRALYWDNLTKYSNINYLDSQSKDLLAYFLARLGKKMGVNHGISTGATINQAKDCLKKIGYNDVSISTKDEDCFRDIRNGLIVCIFGMNKNKSLRHAWVVDAYKYFSTKYYDYGSSNLRKEDVRHYLSFNWGWGSFDHVYCLVGEPYQSFDTGFTYIVNIK